MSYLSVFDDQPTRCPECDQGPPIPIIYGAPSQEMTIAARLGEIVIGGEAFSEGAPMWACARSECGFQF